MPRPDKVRVVEEIRESLRGAGSVLVTEYRGLKVKDLQDLRRRLSGTGARYSIHKNTLMRLAVRDLDFGDLEPYLEGPIAIAFCETDPVAAAKVLSEFSRTNASLVLKASVLQGKVLDAERTKVLADLESREVLLARVAGATRSPLAQAASVMQAVVRNTVLLVSAYLSKREQETASEAPASISDSDIPAETASDSPAGVTDEAATDSPSDPGEADPDRSPDTPDTPKEG
jgi:large subunit ribosomal protein L10